ncbi:MAG TPA: TRAP transporter substrate-binding protein [Candidatus Sulfotelmatobacter sp.]|nr:TRAP transporter substrate-binding protein [Candidatus Sulfotelmatobacter sp.]
MDRRAFLKTGAGVAGFTLAAPYVARGAAPLTLRFAHFADEGHPANIAAKQFASQVEKRTGGAIKVNIFPNNQLGGPPEQAQQLKLGTIDMGLPTQGQLDKYDKAFAAVMLPFIFDNSEQVFRVLDGPAMDWLAPLAEKQGFILLRNWDYGFRNVTNSVRPVNTPDDLKGMKLRTPPELQIQASMEACGAVVQAIAFPELYLALSQKVVDGEENPIAVIYFNKFYEVQKYLAITRHIYNNMIHTVAAATWAKLSPEQQKIFREESTAAGNLMRKLIAEQEADQITKLGAGGMQITRPNLAPFRAHMEPAYQRIEAYAGAENVKRFRDMVEKYRKA